MEHSRDISTEAQGQLRQAGVGRSLRKVWRLHGAKACLVVILTFPLFGSASVGLGCAAMLTVPCGITQVNTTPWLWALRQAYFGLVALANFLLA